MLGRYKHADGGEYDLASINGRVKDPITGHWLGVYAIYQSVANGEWYARDAEQFTQRFKPIARADAVPVATIPDGYVLVPIKPTKEILQSMVAATFLDDHSHLEMQRRYSGMLSALPSRAAPPSPAADGLREAVLDAALVWACCPGHGAYKDGPSVEDTCEMLTEAVEAYHDIDIAQSIENCGQWTIAGMRAALAQPAGAKEA